MARRKKYPARTPPGWRVAEAGLAPGGESAVARIREGYAWDSVARFQRTYELPDRNFAALIGISGRSLSRHRTQGQALDAVASDRFYRVARIVEAAAAVFEDREGAIRWLRRPQPGLGGAVPMELLDTEPGSRAVERLLAQIDFGVLP